MSEKLLSELIKVLTKEKNIYEKLHIIAEEKKETLINNEIDSLFKHVENDREYIEKISKLEDKRKSIIKEINEKFNIKSEELSYLDFIDKLPDNWGEKLNPLREDLLEILEDFHVQNKENKRLIEEAVKFNKFSIDLIIDNLNKNEYTYHETGKSSPQLLDKRG